VIDSRGRDIGRIFKPRAGVPPDHPWMWAITGAVVMPSPSIAWLLCQPGGGRGGVRKDVARVAGATHDEAAN